MELITRMHTLELIALCHKATIYQLTTMLATSKNVLFQGNKHLVTTGSDDPLLACAGR